MGVFGSSCDPSKVQNIHARAFIEKVIDLSNSLPESVRNQKEYKRLVDKIYDSMKVVPENEKSFGMLLAGYKFGDLFLNNVMAQLKVLPDSITKISLRNSGFSVISARGVTKFILDNKHLQEIDLSENKFDNGVSYILSSVTIHPCLKKLTMEDCNIEDGATPHITSLLSNNRNINSLHFNSGKFGDESVKIFDKALRANRSLTYASISKKTKKVEEEMTERNKYINTIVENIVISPFKRVFATKVAAFKSIKGRQMLAGRAKQKDEAKKTNPDIFQKLEETDQRAREIDSKEIVQKTGRFRSGKAEIVGRRPTMEDVSIIMDKCPTETSILFGIFDGHGGREAAEFAGENLPKNIASRLETSKDLNETLTNSFRFIQMDMKPWCVYVGCTACLAIIDGRKLTLANIGDTRAVICRQGKAVRLTVDHKPDIPEETAYIESKGSFVRDARIGGMLAVSRALGDGFLGDAVNPTPYINTIDLEDTDLFLIIACDGVWDVITDQEACDIVMTEVDPLSAATKLIDAAYQKESTDNISVIVVLLQEALAAESAKE